ncbi:hypothetical protein ACFOWM_08465 [Ferruginibacter yonginensis]|uniref:Uncharacterized protein n=1 Tax=Ferruginibacter yonginensis TaxID=1310416 RepID=A0ABV8QRT3_9BACT
MKKLILSLLAATLMTVSFAQTADKMLKHSGETLDVKILKVGEETITYKYPGEDAEQTIGKFAVAKITYGSSNRVENITEKIVIGDKDDWENVQILTSAAQVVGLRKGEEVKGKTSGFISYNSAGSADKKATKRIKQDAADLGAPFILMLSDKADNFGIKQSMKKGVVYYYK